MNGVFWKDTERGKKVGKKLFFSLPPPHPDWTWHNLSSLALWVATQSQYKKQMLLLKFLQNSSDNQAVLITW